MSLYYLSAGSNMGDRMGYLRGAAEELSRRGVSIIRKSSVYETDPWGKTDQPCFLNAVLTARWDGTAEALLQVMLSVEAVFGRRRLVHWGPRTLDLDLLYGEGLSEETPFLTLPHPYFWERLFVLVPLAEVAPDFAWHGELVEKRIEALGGRASVRLREDLKW